MQKQDTRLKGSAPEVNLGKAQHAADEYLEAEAKEKTEAKAKKAAAKTEAGKESKTSKVGQKRQELSEKGRQIPTEE